MKQRWPAAHWAPVPQTHAPDVQPLERTGSHATHADAFAPHACRDGVRVQLMPVQHPAHDVASHTQLPATQCWPSAHAGPVPHWQAPSTEHESAVTPSHESHDAPAVPQAARLRLRHCPIASQQPSGQDAAVHWQVPPTHCWPAEHCAPAPQLHAPAAEQPSARKGSHATHACAFCPHVASERVLHVLPVQHPFVQVAAQPLHVPLAHVSAPGQLMHCEPAAPQAAAVVAVTHAPVAVQQPVHEVESQTHAPPTQRWPAAHGLPAPHMHAPCAEHASDVIASHRMHWPPPTPHCTSERGWHTLPSQQPFGQLVASQVHTPPSHFWPLVHAAEAPHWQAPSAEQLSAREGSHATQVAPARPHVASARAVHAVPWQQPPGHERSSQTHSPARQR